MMPVLVSESPQSAPVEILPHKTWTRAEMEVLDSTGLMNDKHFELIEGELIDKMGKKRRHVIAAARTANALRALFGEQFINTEAPIDVSPQDNPTNEPEPDIVVLRRPFEAIEANPNSPDIALIVEIADSTLRHHLTTKARLYARAGIAEYWVVDVTNRRLHVLRNPLEGVYSDISELPAGASVEALARPNHSVPVAALLPD